MAKYSSPAKIITFNIPREEAYKHLVASAESVLKPLKFKRINPPGEFITSTLYQYGSTKYNWFDFIELDIFIDLNYFFLIEPLDETSFAVSIQNMSRRRDEKVLTKFEPILNNIKAQLGDNVSIPDKWEEASMLFYKKNNLSSPLTFMKSVGFFTTL